MLNLISEEKGIRASVGLPSCSKLKVGYFLLSCSISKIGYRNFIKPDSEASPAVFLFVIGYYLSDSIKASVASYFSSSVKM
jgi:hypothetical protein